MSVLSEIFYNLSPERSSSKWSHYFEIYERHFSRYCGHAPRVLEIGIQGGGSLDMWLRYFGPGATVTGVDIDPACKGLERDNISIEIGDQGSRDFWRGFRERHPERVDILIDDGGHHVSQQIITLQEMFQWVKPGGVYLCEDTHSSFWPSYGGAYTGGVGGFIEPGDQTFTDYVKNLIDVLHWHHMSRPVVGSGAVLPAIDMAWWELFGNVKSMHAYDSVIVLEKGNGQSDLREPLMVDSANRNWRGHVPVIVPEGWVAPTPYYLRRGDK